MSLIKKIFCLNIFLLIFFPLTAQPPLKQLPAYRCVHYDRNVLHFPNGHERLDTLYAKIDSLLVFGRGEINVWHVGGSHVQADIFSHRMRLNLSNMIPDLASGRGILFPYPIARTNYGYNYKVSYTGNWTTGKNTKKEQPYRLGITGMAARTSDENASITLRLNTDGNELWKFNELRILGYGSNDSIFPYIVNGTDTLYAQRDSIEPGYIIHLKNAIDSTTLYMNLGDDEWFTLTGIEPDNRQGGIRYFSSGVNGAAVPAWLRCVDLQRDLQLVKPDLVIFAIGINDAAVPYGRFDAEHFKWGYRQLIDQVLRVSPNCAFIFITNNDSYRYVSRRRMAPNANGRIVQEAFYDLAKEYKGAVWDLFDIMGGYGSVDSWELEGLVRRDRLHFTVDGYNLLGDLLYNALLTDYLFER